MKFNTIPQFTRSAKWAVDISWRDLEAWLANQVNQGFDADPDFQRAHVWTSDQKVRYVEFILRGGLTGKDILTNHPSWQSMSNVDGPYVLVDGKQRLSAVLGFLRGEVLAFGHRFEDFEDRTSMRHKLGFKWHVNDLQTRAEVLQWYLDLNTGGTVHASDEIERVRALLEAEHV